MNTCLYITVVIIVVTSKIYRQEAGHRRLTYWEEPYQAVWISQICITHKSISQQMSFCYKDVAYFKLHSYVRLNVLQRFNLEDTMNSSCQHSIFKIMRIEHQWNKWQTRGKICFLQCIIYYYVYFLSNVFPVCPPPSFLEISAGTMWQHLQLTTAHIQLQIERRVMAVVCTHLFKDIIELLCAACIDSYLCETVCLPQ